jgi:DNA polymerase (family 10)
LTLRNPNDLDALTKTMPVHNSEIAALFDEIADLLELQEANPFRIRAYRNAARTLGELGRSVKTMVEQREDLDALPGIGPDLAGKIVEVVGTGTCALLERLRAEVPADLGAILRLPHLGPKRVRALHQELGVCTLEQLRAAAQAGRVQTVHGFGPRLQQQILEATQASLAHVARVRLNAADEVAASLLACLRGLPGVERAEAAGSLRRRRDSIGDLDLLAQSARGREVVDAFVRLADVREVLSAGATRASVVLKGGLQVDLRVVAAASFGAAWVHFTGSKAHNIALRRLAQQRGLKINEYGVFRGTEPIDGRDEASVYAALGLPLIEPELREDRGEFEAAFRKRLPRLVERADLRGDLHAHTEESDGHDNLEALVRAARSRGLTYLAITDHSQRLALTHGLDAARLARQIDAIDKINAGLKGFTLLKGIEVDILDDGRLDLPDTILRRLDLVVGAVHSRFELSRERQTERVLRAMDHKHFSVLAHPSGRLIEERAAYAIDLARVIRHAHERGCFLELNAHPARLDLDDAGCLAAKAAGVLVAINSDAHSALEFDNLALGVGQARRGWLEAADVLNTRPIEALRPLLARTMAG